MGDWKEMGTPQLPQQCRWIRDAFKILGIYFGTDKYMEKNWEGLSEHMIRKIQQWRWILPQLSYRGRCLIINDLATSLPWHKFTVLNPPKDFSQRYGMYSLIFSHMVTIGFHLEFCTCLWQREDKASSMWSQ